MAVDLKGMKTSTESPGSTFSGYPVLAAILVLLILIFPTRHRDFCSR